MPLSALEWDICVSASDLVRFPDPDSDVPVASPQFTELINELGLPIDPTKVYEHYFFDTKVGAGDVHVYRSRESQGAVFVIDYYRDMHDQLDLIDLFIKVSERSASQVASFVRAFFDSSEYQVVLQQANCSTRLQELLRPDRCPHKVPGSNYEQLMYVHKDA